MSPLAKVLGYKTSKSFLSGAAASALGQHSFSHLCRRISNHFRLQGIYVLGESAHHSPTPVVALFHAEDEAEARQIHRLVWNQDFVPFVLVESPKVIRLYSGFQYQSTSNDESGIINPLGDFNRIQEVLSGFHASEIDDGLLWAKWGEHVDPSKRVDWHLLDNLEKLGRRLRSLGLDKEISHAFIGRFVYL